MTNQTQTDGEWTGSKIRTSNLLKEKPEFPKKKKFVYLDKYEVQVEEIKNDLTEIHKDIQKLYHLGVILASSTALYCLYKFISMLH